MISEAVTHSRRRFETLLRRASQELYIDHPGMMSSPELLPTKNVIDEGDLELFFAGIDAGLVGLERGGKFNTCDRPTAAGRWSLLSRSKQGGWYNAEYLPQIAAYVDAILRLGYPRERVMFELPATALQLDLAILDDVGRVIVLGEAKRETAMLLKLTASIESRFADVAPVDESKKRGDEARQLAWRLWTVRPELCWLIGPGERLSYRCELEPLRLTPIGLLPAASELGLDGEPPGPLVVPDLR